MDSLKSNARDLLQCINAHFCQEPFVSLLNSLELGKWVSRLSVAVALWLSFPFLAMNCFIELVLVVVESEPKTLHLSFDTKTCII